MKGGDATHQGWHAQVLLSMVFARSDIKSTPKFSRPGSLCPAILIQKPHHPLGVQNTLCLTVKIEAWVIIIPSFIPALYLGLCRLRRNALSRLRDICLFAPVSSPRPCLLSFPVSDSLLFFHYSSTFRYSFLAHTGFLFGFQ
jgi:hypothetical protein